MARNKFKQVCYNNLVPQPPALVKRNNIEILEDEGMSLPDAWKGEKGLETASNSSSMVLDKFTSHRNLKNRHIQLIGIGGTVGTLLFVSISALLYSGGPLSLLLAYIIWCVPILCVTVSTAEMVSFLPIESPFVTMTGIFCDEALEFMQGFNFWVLECALIPYEITGVHTIIKYWDANHSPAIELSIQIVLYLIINISAINVYGEVEFWLSIGKVLLLIGLMLFTFFTMVGANPQHDHYGFRNWTEPSPMLEYLSLGASGRFQGFLACLINLSFTIAGPDYVSLTAVNCGGMHVRSKILPKLFKQVFWRLTLMFIGGALCVGIVCSPRDPKLVSLINNSRPGAAQSPYVVAMQNLGLAKVLPHIVNGLLVLALFSAGNSYTYTSSRTLLGLAKSGKAPKFLTHCTKSGTPLYCVLISLVWGLLSLLQLGENSSIVLNWIVNLITACQLINYGLMTMTYYFFYKFTKVTDFDRSQLPFKGWGQPYVLTVSSFACFSMVLISPYLLYFPNKEYWDLKTFLFSFLMLFIDIALYVVYKIIKRTKWKNPHEVNLAEYLYEIEEYEAKYVAEEDVLSTGVGRFWQRVEKVLF